MGVLTHSKIKIIWQCFHMAIFKLYMLNDNMIFK